MAGGRRHSHPSHPAHQSTTLFRKSCQTSSGSSLGDTGLAGTSQITEPVPLLSQTTMEIIPFTDSGPSTSHGWKPPSFQLKS